LEEDDDDDEGPYYDFYLASVRAVRDEEELPVELSRAAQHGGLPLQSDRR